ncbi:rhomboid family intramembrane serine protease [uncultured Cohaesibacter sp.]|uniref:rhomboid family intramembrane serine protease n=1 Tax=uncultured Cohaesibacter sp. TaxID=1002546 RepID=UPI00293191E9|nr:rhomboid family intramembrane serine protease [uncultured Cohaesibacter sp.]
MFNLPTPILVIAGIMIVVQALQDFVLSASQRQEFLLSFSFLPLRYVSQTFALPGGVFADVWTFVTYAFLHGSWMHLILNLVWMLIFATVIVRRIGPLNFALFFVVTAVAGALVHLIIHFGSASPLVGVSAVLSGAMAATARFAFSGGMGGFSGLQGMNRYPCDSLQQLRNNRQAMAFLGIWLVLNLVFGLFSAVGGGASIAWEAHLGGFVAGLLVFPYLDPYSRRPRKPKPPKNDPPKKRPDHLKVIK